MAARISLRVKSGCLATRVKSHSECSSSGEVLPPLGLASTLPVSLRRRHHRITELTPTSNTSATSRRDAPLSTASTARSRKSVEYGFGIDLAPRRINFSRFAWAKAVVNPPDSMPPGNALKPPTATSRASINLFSERAQSNTLERSSRCTESDASNAWRASDLNTTQNSCSIFHIRHRELQEIRSALQSVVDSKI